MKNNACNFWWIVPSISLFIWTACNPFYGYTEAPGLQPEQEEEPAVDLEADLDSDADVDPEDMQSEPDVLLENSEPILPLVKFSLSADLQDAELSVEKNGSLYSFSSPWEYEKYYWKCGDSLLSQERSFELDCTTFTADSYPIVFLAEKNGILYSASYYLSYTASNSRTVLPAFSKASLGNVSLKVYNAGAASATATGAAPAGFQLLSEQTFATCAELESLELSLAEGSYYFEVQASFENFSLSDAVSLECKNGTTSTVNFTPKLSSYSEPTGQSTPENYGKIDLVNYFMTDLVVSDACVRLYKEKNGCFTLCDLRSFGDGSLLFYRGKDDYEDKKYVRYSAQVEPGTYWFRCDCTASDSQTKMASYCMEIIYVSAGSSSCKIIETRDFYKLYSINYVYNGGFYVGSNLPETTASFDTIILPSAAEMVKPGFTFSGWFYDANCTIPAADSFSMGQLKADVTLYASWTPLSEESDTLEINNWCNHIYIEESAESIKLGIKEVEQGDLFVVKVYNKNGILYEAQYSNLEASNADCSMQVDFKCRPGEYYLISLAAYNSTALINDRFVYECRFSENYVFIPGFLH